MTDVLFYHLTDSKLEEALPSLLEKSVERGWKVVVQTRAEARRDFLDAHLWTFRDDSFLPHGTDAGEMAEAQPVLITAEDGNANGATVRFVGDTPWAHLDIAGTAMGSPSSEINQSWGSGYGVRLLDQLVRTNFEA